MLYNYKGDRRAYCRCVCDCGKECIKDCYGMKVAINPPHCGCMNDYYHKKQGLKLRKNLVGLRFGSLVVQEMIYKDGEPTRVTCQCDCGNIIERIATYLTSGDTTSCGCVHKIKTSQNNTKDFTGTTSDYGVELLRQAFKNNHGTWMWLCKCPCCDEEFVALPAKVLNGHITSCGCSKQSSRERLISNILRELDVSYQNEYIFEDCRNIHPLRFDFYLEKFNIVIEYQGEQHYRPVSIFGGESEYYKRKENDRIKEEYCRSNNIMLLVLPYTLSDEEIKSEIMNVICP